MNKQSFESRCAHEKNPPKDIPVGRRNRDHEIRQAALRHGAIQPHHWRRQEEILRRPDCGALLSNARRIPDHLVSAGLNPMFFEVSESPFSVGRPFFIVYIVFPSVFPCYGLLVVYVILLNNILPDISFVSQSVGGTIATSIFIRRMQILFIIHCIWNYIISYTFSYINYILPTSFSPRDRNEICTTGFSSSENVVFRCSWCRFRCRSGVGAQWRKSLQNKRFLHLV